VVRPCAQRWGGAGGRLRRVPGGVVPADAGMWAARCDHCGCTAAAGGLLQRRRRRRMYACRGRCRLCGCPVLYQTTAWGWTWAPLTVHGVVAAEKHLRRLLTRLAPTDSVGRWAGLCRAETVCNVQAGARHVSSPFLLLQLCSGPAKLTQPIGLDRAPSRRARCFAPVDCGDPNGLVESLPRRWGVCWSVLMATTVPPVGGRAAAGASRLSSAAPTRTRIRARSGTDDGGSIPTAVLQKIPHCNSSKSLPNRPLRGRGGRFGTLLGQLECGIFWRTAVRLTQYSSEARGVSEHEQTLEQGCNVRAYRTFVDTTTDMRPSDPEALSLDTM